MRFLIDGYNLIFSAGIGGTEQGPGSLHRARTMMLHHVRKHLTTEEATMTTVVFDAKQAPAGLPDELEQQGIRVLFARNHDEADDLIEELIRHHSTPRRLTIVTSDLRLRQAAARRRARSLTIDEWLDFLEDRQAQQRRANKRPTAQRHLSGDHKLDGEPLTTDQIEAWMTEFDVPRSDQPVPTEQPEPTGVDDESKSSASDEGDPDFNWGPFPPGYGEDLL